MNKDRSCELPVVEVSLVRMNAAEFSQSLASLTQRQQEVLMKVLAGQKDPEIATELHITRDTVRKHIENICKAFNLTELNDSGYSHRADLIALFAKYKPEFFQCSVENFNSRLNILISYYRNQEVDPELISQLETTLKDKGYDVFLANSSLRMATNGLQKVYSAMNKCDILLLLLSPLSACSEMVTEEVRLAKNLQTSRHTQSPKILPIRLNCPMNLLNHDLRGYLQDIPHYEWQNSEDTPRLIQTIVSQLITHYQSPLSPSETPEQLLEQIPKKSKSSFPTAYSLIPNHPPQPVAEPELPRGQVELASAFYIERPGIDERCYEAIQKPGSLIRIKAPRQMGKTSLLARILHQASLQNYQTVPLSFQLADSQVFSSLDLFLKWFCANVARELNLPARLEESWTSIFGSKVACKSYFERYLLPNIATPLALGLDEVDVVFKYPELAADFFGLLRAWHEEAKNREIWKKLRLVVVHATEVYVPMDINQSPFNVGLPIELPEFQTYQVKELARRHGLAWDEMQVQQLMTMVGGHPYLVRLAIYHIARGEITLPHLLKTAATEAGLYSDHLRRHLWNLEQHSHLATALKKVVDSDTPVQLESMQGFKLHSMGLVHLQGNQVIPRCNLYRQYFRVRLSSS
jgi:DNA-binding CsgD family transcriptional regulator